jgi:hypothetical protein
LLFGVFTLCGSRTAVRDDINRVEVPAERLNHWRCGGEAVDVFVSMSLGIRPESQRKSGAGLWELGVTMGKKRSKMVCLRAKEVLELVAGRMPFRWLSLCVSEKRAIPWNAKQSGN